jgi:asparaginyl-tRNA synthetase
MRVRSALSYAVHKFFQERGFVYVHTPLITGADCEGAGEMFQVTTMLNGPEGKPADITAKPDGHIDYSKDFFGKPVFLTVSGQLAVENFAISLSDVYTFGPTFRAENSHTSRHLAEFWMVEPELAFADIWDDMQCAEDFLKFCAKHVYDNLLDDLEFFDKRVEPGLVKRVEKLLAEPFARVSYTEAIEILKKHEKKAGFGEKVEWGMDLPSEMERYLTEKVFLKPVVVYNYPKGIKAFYMRLNDDNETVAAMDVLVPGVGEVIGGSQREERLDVLEKRIKEIGLEPEDYKWYMDLRRYGSVTHSGFGLGLERLIMLVTGITNIRDTIPYPRYPGHADF